MDPTPGAVFPFCRECTVTTSGVPAKSTFSFFPGIGTRYVSWGRSCRLCGSVPRIKFLCYFWIPLIPLGGRYRIIKLSSSLRKTTYLGRRMTKNPVHEDLTTTVARYQETVADHPELMDDQHALADKHWADNNPSDALNPYAATLAKHEKTLGVDHPGALFICRQLALAHLEVRQVTDAIPLLERVFRHRYRVLGPEHPDTAESFWEWANVRVICETWTSPKRMYQQALETVEQNLGTDHPRTLRVRIGLGKACVDAGHEDEAIQHLERSLDDSIRILGPDHPDTALTREDLLNACAAGHKSPHVPHIEQAARVREQLLGADHPDTLATQNRLALGYHETGRTAEAITLWQTVQERAGDPFASEAEQHLRDIARRQR